MPVPKKKRSRTRRGNRRAHDKLAVPALTICPNCQEKKPAHAVCPKCGWYKDAQVVEVEEDI